MQYPNIDKREETEEDADVLIPHDGSVVFGLDPGSAGIEIAKRAALPLPSYVSQYSEQEISSACSCMTITQPIESATATAAPTVFIQLPSVRDG